jgi:hypothetical protein
MAKSVVIQSISAASQGIVAQSCAAWVHSERMDSKAASG